MPGETADDDVILAFLSISPLGEGESVSGAVAKCLDVIDASGLDYSLGSMGTTMEGPWGDVMAVVRECFDATRADADRVSILLKVDYRRGRSGRIAGKVESVREKTGRDLRT